MRVFFSSWGKYYGGPETDLGYDLEITYDGGFIITGHSEHKGILLRTNAAGDLEWERTITNYSNEKFLSVSTLNNYGYLFTGTSTPYNHDMFIARTGSAGYPAYPIDDPWDTLAPIHLCPPGLYISNTGDFSLTVSSLFYHDTTKLPTSQFHFFPNMPYADGIYQTLCGSTVGVPEIDLNGNTFNLFPNPASKLTHLIFHSEQAKTGRLYLVNVLGDKVYEQALNTSPGKNEVELHVDNLSDGMYSAILHLEKSLYSTKLLIVH